MEEALIEEGADGPTRVGEWGHGGGFCGRIIGEWRGLGWVGWIHSLSVRYKCYVCLESICKWHASLYAYSAHIYFRADSLLSYKLFFKKYFTYFFQNKIIVTINKTPRLRGDTLADRGDIFL